MALKSNKKPVKAVKEETTLVEDNTATEKSEDVTETKEELPVSVPVAASPAPAPVSPVAKNVEFNNSLISCRILENVNAFIGKKRWTFSAGQSVKIPSNVFEVLKNAKKAM